MSERLGQVTGKPYTPIRILVISNSSRVVALESCLAGEGRTCVVEDIDSPEAMFDALNASECALIIGDFPNSGFDAFAALRALRSAGKRVPFIVVSLAIGSDIPIAAMRLGAADFVRPYQDSDLTDSVKRVLVEAGTLGT